MSMAEIPLIQSLEYAEKLRLMAFLLSEIAQETGVNLSQNIPDHSNQTDALAMLARIAQPIGPEDLARHFDHYTDKTLSSRFDE